MKKLNIIGVDDKYEKILWCAMRYALGRRTYLTMEVIDYIKKVLPALSFGHINDDGSRTLKTNTTLVMNCMKCVG